MPIVSGTIMEAPEHVFRPVIEQTARRVITSLDMDDVIGDNLYINADFMARTRTSTITKDAIVNVEAMRVDATIQINPTSQKWDVYNFTHTAAYGLNGNTFHDNVPLYEDFNNGVRLVQFQAPVTITMNCMFHVESANVAYHLSYKLYQMFGTGPLPFYQDLIYDFPIPKQVVHVLHEIYKLDRISGKPAGVSFADYVTQRTNNTWAVVRNRYHEELYEVVQNVRDLQVLTTVEYSDEKPNADKHDDSPAVWEIPVVVTVQFGVPQMTLLKFPVVICNQLVPASCIPTDKTARINRLRGVYPWNKLTGYKIEDTWNHHAILPMVPAKIPHYDDWVPTGQSRIFINGQRTIVTIGVLLDETSENYKTVLDFNKFEDPIYNFHPYVLKIIELERHLAIHETSLICISVFENNLPLMPGKDVSINKGVLTFTGGKLSDQYHVLVSICHDLSRLNDFYYFLLDWFYDYFDYSMRTQIDMMIERGVLKPPYTMTDDGNIFDGNGNFVGNIDNPTLEDGGIHNGVLIQSRVLGSNIIAK